MLQGLQKRSADEELAIVEIPLEALRVVFRSERLGRSDVEELPRVVPLVDGLVDVYALVALEAYEGRIEDAGEDLGDLRLADPGLALEKERLPELEGQKDRRREPLVRQVVVLPEPSRQVPSA